MDRPDLPPFIHVRINSQNSAPTIQFIQQCQAEANALPNGDGSLLSVRQFLLLGHITGHQRYLKATDAFTANGHDGRLKTAYWHVSRQNLTNEQAWAHGYKNKDDTDIPQWDPHRKNPKDERGILKASQVRMANKKAAELKDRPDWVAPPPAAIPPPPPLPPVQVNIPHMQRLPRDQRRLANGRTLLPSGPDPSNRERRAPTANMTTNMNLNSTKGSTGRSKGKTHTKENTTGVLDGFREAEGEYNAESRMESTTHRRPRAQPSGFAVARSAPAVRRKRKEPEPEPEPESTDEVEYEPQPASRRRPHRKSEVSGRGRRKVMVNVNDEMDLDLDEDELEVEDASNDNGKTNSLPGEHFYNKFAYPRDRGYQGSGLQAHLERPLHLTKDYRADIGLYLGEPARVSAVREPPSSRSTTAAHAKIRSHSYDPGLQFSTPEVFAQYKNSQYRNRTSRTTAYDADQEEAEMIEYERATIARRQAKANMTAGEYQRGTAKQTGLPAPRNFSPLLSTPFLPDPESVQYALENQYRGVPEHRLPAELSVHTQPQTTDFQKWKGHVKERTTAPVWINDDDYCENIVGGRSSTSLGDSREIATPSQDSPAFPSASARNDTETSSQRNEEVVATPSTGAAGRAFNVVTSRQRDAATTLRAEYIRAVLESAPPKPAEVKFYERVPGIKSLVPGHGSPVIKKCPSHVVCDSMAYRCDLDIKNHPSYKFIKSKMPYEPTPEVPNIIFYKAMWLSTWNTEEIRESRDFVSKVPTLSLDRWDGVRHLACHFTTVDKFTKANVVEFITKAYNFYPNKPQGEKYVNAELAVDPQSLRLRWKRWKPVADEDGDQDEVATPAHEYRWNHDVEDIQADNAVYGTLIIEFGVRKINENERRTREREAPES